MCALLLAGGTTARAASFTWTQTAAGTFEWDDAASNWTSGFPNAIDDTAGLSVDLAGDQTVNLNQAITVGSLTINDSGASGDSKFTVAAGTAGALTLQTSSGNAALTFSSASNTISAPLTIASTATITNSANGNIISGAVAVNAATTINAVTNSQSITLSGPLRGSANITKSGAGQLSLTGDNSAYTGKWILAGTNNSSTLSINSDLALGAIPGAATVNIQATGSANSLALSNGVSLNANRTIQIDTGAMLAINSTGTATVNGKITGAGGLRTTSSTSNVLVLTNTANDFAGGINFTSGGTIRISSLGNVGEASALGAGDVIAFSNGTFGGSGVIDYVGAGNTSNRTFQLSSTGSAVTVTINNNGTGALNLTNTTNFVTGISTGARTLVLGGTNADANVFSQKVNANGAGVVSVTKSGAGTWKLADVASSYTGATTIGGGILEVTKLADGGSVSSLGAATNAATTLVVGNTTGTLTGTLRYTGSGDSTDRLFTVGANNSSGMTGMIESSGTGALAFTNTGNIAWGTTNQARTLKLGGTNTADNSLAAIIANNGTAAVSLTKQDAGKWIISGANTYTGATTINGGSLIVNGSLAAGSAVTVNSGGTLGGSGTIGGAVTVNSGGFLAPGNSPGVLTVGSLNLAAGSTTSLEIGGAVRGAGYDGITVGTTSGLTYGGTLSLAFTSTLADLDTLDLFSFTGTAGGAFTSVVSTGSYAGTWTDGSGVWTFTGNDRLLTFDLSTGDLSVVASVVPEPSTYALFGGALALAFAGWRSRRRG
ncbi:MAG TPA: autotransporter-associated beta strand repeat-containing protein [Rariglobus sp.]